MYPVFPAGHVRAAGVVYEGSVAPTVATNAARLTPFIIAPFRARGRAMPTLKSSLFCLSELF